MLSSPSSHARILGRISPIMSRMTVTLAPGPSGAIRAALAAEGASPPLDAPHRTVRESPA